jgi:hypothetical protein
MPQHASQGTQHRLAVDAWDLQLLLVLQGAQAQAEHIASNSKAPHPAPLQSPQLACLLPLATVHAA